jgi:CheY-like chemotaxis protein
VQGAIAVYFSQKTDVDSSAAIELLLDTMLAQSGPDAEKSRAEAARLLGVISGPPELHARIGLLLSDSSAEVVDQALLSTGKIRDVRFLPLIIERLGQHRHTTTARAALVLYGEGAVGVLGDRLSDRGVPMAVRRQIPRVLAKIASPESASVLGHALAQSDPGLRFDVLRALNKVREKDPGLLPLDVDFADMINLELMGYLRSFQILAAFGTATPEIPVRGSRHSSELLFRRALLERMDQELERIFRLLALIYSSRDIHNAFVGITSRQARLEANALEVLEHMLHPELYRRLANVLDPEIGIRERLDFARQFCRIGVHSRAEALRILLHSEDRWMRVCALYAIGGLRIRELGPEIEGLSRDADPLLAETAIWTLSRLAVNGPA